MTKRTAKSTVTPAGRSLAAGEQFESGFRSRRSIAIARLQRVAAIAVEELPTRAMNIAAFTMAAAIDYHRNRRG